MKFEIARVSTIDCNNNRDIARKLMNCDAFAGQQFHQVIATMRSFERIGWAGKLGTDYIVLFDAEA